MYNLRDKISKSLSLHGVWQTVFKVLRHPYVLLGSNETRFTKIYKINHWSSQESRSGEGSGLVYTKNLRSQLPHVFQKYNIHKLLDAPCGDFNWMQHVIIDSEIEYIGGDIVRDIVVNNNNSYGSEKILFMHLNIISDALPEADMMIVRDCLFHFCYKDIHKFLNNFYDSNIPLLLTTNHLGSSFKNYDIRTGGYREINLFATPFSFPSSPLLCIKDYIEPHVPREMCLFNREQVKVALIIWRANYL